jgi:hypothetical protein
MKKETRMLGAIAAALLTAVAAPASAQMVDVVANVPFEFRVGNDTMPRAVYRISRATQGSSALMLRSDYKGVVVLVRRGGSSEARDNPKLVFHRIGDQYFLREVQLLGGNALELPETRAEREALQQIASSAPAGMRRVVISGR